MNLNTIARNQPPGPKASNAPRSGVGDFEVAYTRALGERYAPLARAVATPPSSRGQDSPAPADEPAHTVRAGETLYGIVRARLAAMPMDASAKASMQGVKQLAQANQIQNPDRIYVGQTLDLSALASSMGHQTAPTAGRIDRSATATVTATSTVAVPVPVPVPSEIDQPQPWHWVESVPEAAAYITAEVAATLPLTTDALPPVITSDDDAAAVVDTSARTPLALREAALYEQTASITLAKPAESVRALPDIVYKGVVGKVLDAMPLEPSTRTGLQQANAVVSGVVIARTLGALTGFGAPLLTVAGLIWGIFSAQQIDAAATGASKAIGPSTRAGDPKPVDEAMQTAQNNPPDTLN